MGKAKWIRGRPYFETLGKLGKIVRRDILALIGASILATTISMAVLAPLLTPYLPEQTVLKEEADIFTLDSGVWRLNSVIGRGQLNGITQEGERVWAVGEGGSIYMMEDRTWRPFSSPTGEVLYDISMAEGYGLAVGRNGTVLEWKEQTWRLIEAPSKADFYSVVVLGNGKGLIVGSGENVLILENGAWRVLHSAPERGRTYYGVSALDGKAVIVGSSGSVLQYQDGALISLPSPVREDLLAVTHISRERFLAVGSKGTILLWDGKELKQLVSPSLQDLKAVAYISENQALIVGREGTVLRASGEVVEVEPAEPKRHLTAVSIEQSRWLVAGSEPFLLALIPPMLEHPAGTDFLGRDIFSQTLFGARTSLFIGSFAAFSVVTIGTLVGLVAGYYRGKVDNALMRLVDIMYSIPFEPFAIILAMMSGPGILVIIAAIALLVWRSTARIIRSQVLSIIQRPFVKAARVAGCTDIRIMFVHILPNVLPLIFLDFAVTTGWAILAEASLSFLGLGPADVISWGVILNRARLSGSWRVAWWSVVPPGILITITVTAIFLVTRALEIIANPRLRRW